MGLRSSLSDEDLNTLRLILLDHRDCLVREDYPMTCGKSVVERLGRQGVDLSGLPMPEGMEIVDEIDSKANLIWQIDGLVKKLEETR